MNIGISIIARRARIALGVFLLGTFGCGGAAPAASVHPCSGAGKWFPADPAALRTEVERCLAGGKGDDFGSSITALVVPHAGYAYSGPTAGAAYRRIAGKVYERVVILAVSHATAVDGASVLDVEAYETPLGSIPVDRAAVRKLLGNPLFHSTPKAHAVEHSDENQLPFLQVALGKFQLVSILVGRVDGSPEGLKRVAGLADAVIPLLDAKSLLVVSSDLTHYGKPYGYVPFRANAAEDLRALDGEAIADVLNRDRDGFLDLLERSDSTVCGAAPLALLLEIVRRDPAQQGVFLQYDRGGDPSDAASPSVGYGALAFVKSPRSPLPAPPDWVHSAADRAMLNDAEQATLIAIARASIAAKLAGRAFDPLGSGDFEITPRLMANQGAFVSLFEGRRLRGCIGAIAGQGALCRTVAAMAREAAFGDDRFKPLAAGELARLRLEVSVMLTHDGRVAIDPESPLTDVEKLRLGVDGIDLRKEGKRGLFLPEVAPEQGWDREKLLRQAGLKAGLTEEAWRGADLRVFTVQKFEERSEAAAGQQ